MHVLDEMRVAFFPISFDERPGVDDQSYADSAGPDGVGHHRVTEAIGKFVELKCRGFCRPLCRGGTTPPTDERRKCDRDSAPSARPRIQRDRFHLGSDCLFCGRRDRGNVGGSSE